MRKIFERIFRQQKRKENVLLEEKYERETLVSHAREQFMKLSKKGLSIPVFTL